jgi:hypothetical protein
MHSCHFHSQVAYKEGGTSAVCNLGGGGPHPGVLTRPIRPKIRIKGGIGSEVIGALP